MTRLILHMRARFAEALMNHHLRKAAIHRERAEVFFQRLREMAA